MGCALLPIYTIALITTTRPIVESAEIEPTLATRDNRLYGGFPHIYRSLVNF
jgi:hypothetical protein